MYAFHPVGPSGLIIAGASVASGYSADSQAEARNSCLHQTPAAGSTARGLLSRADEVRAGMRPGYDCGLDAAVPWELHGQAPATFHPTTPAQRRQIRRHYAAMGWQASDRCGAVECWATGRTVRKGLHPVGTVTRISRAAYQCWQTGRGIYRLHFRGR